MSLADVHHFVGAGDLRHSHQDAHGHLGRPALLTIQHLFVFFTELHGHESPLPSVNTTACEEVVIGGVARWLGQTGAAAISQARDFTFTVNVVSETTNGEERIITETEAEPGGTQELAEPASTTEAPQDATTTAETTVAETTTIAQTSGTDNESDSTLGKWLPAIIAAVIVVLGAIIIFLIVRRRHGQ